VTSRSESSPFAVFVRVVIIAERNKYNDEVSLRDWNSGPRIAMRGFVHRADFDSWMLFEPQIQRRGVAPLLNSGPRIAMRGFVRLAGFVVG